MASPQCPECDGAGEILNSRGDEGKPCDRCGGTGEAEDREDDPDAQAKYERDEIFLLEAS